MSAAKSPRRPGSGRPAAAAGHLLAILLWGSASWLDAPLEAADWPRFRGPNGLGTTRASSLPVHVGPETNVVWRREIPPGHSSPIVVGGDLYLTGREGEQLVTLRIDADSGKTLWRRAAPRPRREKLDPRNDPAAPTPAADEERVVVFFPDFGLLAYDRAGSELWRRPLGPFNNLYGMGASPILVDDLAVLAADQHTGSYLLAVDKRSGAERWRTARPEATSGHSTPVLYQPPGGGQQILLPGSFFLTSYAAADGERLWWVRGLSFEMKSTPVLAAGRLYINGYGSNFNEVGARRTVAAWSEVLPRQDRDGDGSLSREEQPDELSTDWFPFNDLDGDGSLSEKEWTYYQAAMATENSILAIDLAGASERGDLTGSHVAWQYHRSVPQLPSPLLYEGVLYMINDRGIVTSFEPKSGEVLAQGRIEGAVDSYYASPVAADGKIYFLGRSGKVAVLPPGGSLDPLAVNDLDAEIVATPAIARDRIYIRTDGALYAFAVQPKEAQPAGPLLDERD